MGKDKKRKLSETSSSVGELQRQGNFKIDQKRFQKRWTTHLGRKSFSLPFHF